MHPTARRTGTIATLAAATFFGTTSAAGAFPSYRHCDLYNPWSDGAGWPASQSVD